LRLWRSEGSDRKKNFRFDRWALSGRRVPGDYQKIFRQVLPNSAGLIPANGFHEWRKTLIRLTGKD